MLQPIPGFALQPSAARVPLSTNYINDFDFMNQYLPETYEQEFERYGNRSVASFLRLVSAEFPAASDMIKWSEQGRLHIKYTDCETDGMLGDNTATITVNDAEITANVLGTIALRRGQTVMIVANDGSGYNRASVRDVDVDAGTFDVAYYEADGQAFADDAELTVFIYGSEFRKGTFGMEGSQEATPVIFENTPIILKDHYGVSGSDMAQIGWIEITTEDGATGYLWYLKSQHETRLRFEDYLETSMIEAIPAAAGSGAEGVNLKGTEGVFYVVESRGNVFGGHPTTLDEYDTIIMRLDAQGAIEENVLFVNRTFSLDLSDMLAGLNTNAPGGASWGLFNNEQDMALNLGFSGFRRGGYDFYQTDWKYLNDPTMRGGMPEGCGRVDGLLVPAGTTTVYDQVLGKNLTRPFLHMRYRKSEAEDRRYKTWVTGSAGGASTSSLDAMEVHFLSERCVCTLGANNFMLFIDECGNP